MNIDAHPLLPRTLELMEAMNDLLAEYGLFGDARAVEAAASIVSERIASGETSVALTLKAVRDAITNHELEGVACRLDQERAQRRQQQQQRNLERSRAGRSSTAKPSKPETPTSHRSAPVSSTSTPPGRWDLEAP